MSTEPPVTLSELREPFTRLLSTSSSSPTIQEVIHKHLVTLIRELHDLIYPDKPGGPDTVAQEWHDLWHNVFLIWQHMLEQAEKRDDPAGRNNRVNEQAGAGTPSGADADSDVAEKHAEVAEKHAESESDPLKILAKQWNRLRGDSSAKRFLGDIGDPGEDPATVWTTVHLACLRLPDDRAAQWRKSFADAMQIETDPRVAGVPEFPNRTGVTLFVAGQTPIGSQWHDQVRTTLGTRADDFPDVSVVVGNVLTLLDMGERNVVTWINPSQKKLPVSDQTLYRQYCQALNGRLAALAAAEDARAEFEELIAIDEFVRSVVHTPLPAPNSWWERTVNGLKPVIQAKANAAGIEVKYLTTSYEECRNYTENNTRYPDPKHRGDVLRALRLAYKSGDEWKKGRVIYAE